MMKTVRTTIFTIVAMAVVALMQGCSKPDPEAFLASFYEEYLPLTCSAYDVPDYEQVQACLHKYLSRRAYDELELRRDADRDDWLDYDIFIQGQDCWPGIRVEKVSRVEESDWYDVVVVLPDFINSDSIIDRNHVFFYIEEGEQGWQVGAVDDGHNRLGSAPRKDEAALKRRQWQNQFEEGVRWEQQYADDMNQLLQREADYNDRLSKAAEQIAPGDELTDFELIADIPTTRDRYLVFWQDNDEQCIYGEGEHHARFALINNAALIRAAGCYTPWMERYIGMLEWADGWPAEYIYEGVSYLRHCHPAEVDAVLDSLFPDKEWLKEEIKDHQQWFENNSTDKKWKK